MSDYRFVLFCVQPRTEEQERAAEGRLLKRQEERKRKLADAGIEYDFEAVAYVSSLSQPSFFLHKISPNRHLILFHSLHFEFVLSIPVVLTLFVLLMCTEKAESRRGVMRLCPVAHCSVLRTLLYRNRARDLRWSVCLAPCFTVLLEVFVCKHTHL